MLLIAGYWCLARTNTNLRRNDEEAVPAFRSIRLCSFLGRLSLSIEPRRLLEASTAMTGLVMSWGVCHLITDFLKATIARPRPNFYAKCEFDYDNTHECLADPSHICEAQYSFPSGHSSLSACPMTYLACYFCGKLLAALNKSEMPRCVKPLYCLSIGIPLISVAVFVGATRVWDHHHFVGDVVAGLLLGIVTAFTVYHLYYPPLWNAYAVGTPRIVWSLAKRQQTTTTNNKMMGSADDDEEDASRSPSADLETAM